MMVSNGMQSGNKSATRPRLLKAANVLKRDIVRAVSFRTLQTLVLQCAMSAVNIRTIVDLQLRQQFDQVKETSGARVLVI
jgi:hypothetical protein